MNLAKARYTLLAVRGHLENLVAQFVPEWPASVASWREVPFSHELTYELLETEKYAQMKSTEGNGLCLDEASEAEQQVSPQPRASELSYNSYGSAAKYFTSLSFALLFGTHQGSDVSNTRRSQPDGGVSTS